MKRALAGLMLAAIAAGGCASPGSLRPAAFPTAPVRPEPARRAAPPGATTPEASRLIRTAIALEGTPYRFGGDSPAGGFDCSGFVQYVFSQYHVGLPRTVGEQYALGARVRRPDIREGDLVFFTTNAPGVSHVGLAIDHDEFIHAPSERGVVRVERLDTPYWRDRIVGARRMF
jgi:cell wall-associated NlpC family hydrolase